MKTICSRSAVLLISHIVRIAPDSTADLLNMIYGGEAFLHHVFFYHSNDAIMDNFVVKVLRSVPGLNLNIQNVFGKTAAHIYLIQSTNTKHFQFFVSRRDKIAVRRTNQ